MLQQGQLVRLKKTNQDGDQLWAYRFRVAGRGSSRVQRGGFASERDAQEALARALERLRRENGSASALTLAELVDVYLAQHDAEPVTIEKLRWLLAKAVAVFGDLRVRELRSQEIAAWRMTIPPGYRFDATQALRQRQEMPLRPWAGCGQFAEPASLAGSAVAVARARILASRGHSAPTAERVAR